jgi:hypothetical protein
MLPLKLLASRQTHRQGNNNNNKTRRKTAQEQNTNVKHAECDDVKKRQRTKKAVKQDP